MDKCNRSIRRGLLIVLSIIMVASLSHIQTLFAVDSPEDEQAFAQVVSEDNARTDSEAGSDLNSVDSETENVPSLDEENAPVTDGLENQSSTLLGMGNPTDDNAGVVQQSDASEDNLGTQGNPVSNPVSIKKSITEVNGVAYESGKTEVYVGDIITYTINFSKTGYRTSSVQITDTLPGGLNNVSWTGDTGITPSSSPQGQLVWNTKLASGTITVTGTVSEGTQGSTLINSVVIVLGSCTCSDSAKVSIKVKPDPEPTKKIAEGSAAGQGGSTVAVGDKITYEISCVNNSNKTATMTFSDTLPAGVTYVSSNPAYTTVADGTYTWTFSDVPAGESKTVVVTVEVNENAVDSITNVAAVSIGGGASVQTNQVENPVTPTLPTKSISADSKAGQGGAEVSVGDEITYVIEYRNNSSETANIVITDTLPQGETYVSSTHGGSYDEDTHTVTWTLADVPSGAKGTVEVTAAVNERAASTVENTALVADYEHELFYETNPVENPVTPTPPVKKVISDVGLDGSAVKAGQTMIYEIDYKNNTSSTAVITISDKLPLGEDYVASSDGGVYNPQTGTVTWIIQGVEPGAMGNVTLTVKINEESVSRVANVASLIINYGNPEMTNEVINPVTSDAPENPDKPTVNPSDSSSKAGTSGKTTPKTGDMLGFWILGAALALLVGGSVLGITMYRNRKSKREGDGSNIS